MEEILSNLAGEYSDDEVKAMSRILRLQKLSAELFETGLFHHSGNSNVCSSASTGGCQVGTRAEPEFSPTLADQ